MILLGQKQAVAQWVIDRIEGAAETIDPDQWFDCLGFMVNGELKGGVVYYNYNGYDIEAMAAGEDNWLTPWGVRAIFLYPFETLGCRRFTVIAAKGNKDSRQFITRLGFKLEGVQKRAMADGQDAMLYGMLKENCRWIDGKEKSQSAGRKSGRRATGGSQSAGGGNHASA